MIAQRLPRDARTRGGGFTYLEALLVALLILILAGISIPLLNPRSQIYRVRAAALQVAGDLRLARQRAVTTRARYRLVFADSAASADPNTYVLQYAIPRGGADTWVQERPPAAGSRLRLAEAVQIDPDSTPSTGAITFNPNGSVVPAGTIRLRSAAAIARVRVDSLGRVQVDRP